MSETTSQEATSGTRRSSARTQRHARSGAPASMARLLETLGMADQEQLVDSLTEAVDRVHWSRTVPVSASDAAYLREHAGLDDPTVLDEWSAEAEDALRARSAATSAAQLLADTLNREEIAEVLGIAPTRVSHRARDGHLYAVRRDGKPRFPRWQVRDGVELPGLRTLVPVLEKTGLDPVSVATFMAIHNDELDTHSPADFLAAGGNPERVAELLDAWARQ